MSVLKKEFIDRMAETGGITKKAAREGLELFIETLMDCMDEDEKVMIKGFGRFEMRTVKERKGRMPLGGEDCIVPEHRKMKFFVSREVAKRMRKIEGEYIDE
jgi:DNA-binding protein HU-beta